MAGVTCFLRVHLIRHGQSGNNVLAATSASSYERSRVADAQLTELGKKQAQAVGAFLAAVRHTSPVPLQQIYTSAMARAVHTGYEIATALGADTAEGAHLRPLVFPDLCEIGGIFEHVYDDAYHVTGYRGVAGMTASQVAERFPLAVLPDDGSITETGWWRSAGKESEEEGVARVRGVLRELLEAGVALQEGGGAAGGLHGFDIRCTVRNKAAGGKGHHHHRLRTDSRSRSASGSGLVADASPADVPVPEAFDTLHSVAGRVHFHVGGGAAPDARESGGEPAPAAGPAAGPAAAAASALPARTRKYDAGAAAAGTPAAPGAEPKPLSERGGRVKLSGTRAAGVALGHGSMAVALVCHGDFIETMLRVIANYAPSNGGAAGSDPRSPPIGGPISPLAAAQFCHHNCGISTFDVFPDGTIRLVRVNDIAHLMFPAALQRPRTLSLQAKGGADVAGIVAGAETAPLKPIAAPEDEGAAGGASSPLYSHELITGGPLL
jgi:broad specificity phosphatase PhoE